MPEIGTSGSMSGDGKRGVGQSAPSHRARPRLYCANFPLFPISRACIRSSTTAIFCSDCGCRQRPSQFLRKMILGMLGCGDRRKTFMASSLIEGIRLMSTKFGAFGKRCIPSQQAADHR